ncbi:MAG: phosphate ABC transporter substrate-binding protein PstS [Deltaproteobacteria bacterium]|nr:phosphate ABC transporter substrate-binding protein PstS [Deltaproteobacteria bacterium]
MLPAMNKLLVIGTFSALSLVAACGSKKEGGGAGGGTADTSAGGGPVTLNASGATFQQGAQEVTIEAFTKANPKIKVNYGAGGSGKGRQDFADQVVDFACSDAPYKDTDLGKVKGGDFYYFPNVLGAITVSYNLDGVDKLSLSAEVIAKIFQRDIKKWNDPAIAADNAGGTLPDADIVVAHRSDGSGTTENFTRYLDKAATGVWKLKAGSTVEWPSDTQAGNGNSGVAQIVKSTKGAIGYVDLSDAKASGLKYASIKNQAGKFTDPTAESVSAAGDGIEVDDKLLFSALNAKGDASYPITAQSWCMLYAKSKDPAKTAALKAYFKYMLTDGQKLLPEIDFAPLPKSLQDKAVAQLDKVQ